MILGKLLFISDVPPVMTVNITTCILIIFRTKPDVKQNVEESTVKNMKFVEITNQKENNYEILPNPFHTPWRYHSQPRGALCRDHRYSFVEGGNRQAGRHESALFLSWRAGVLCQPIEALRGNLQDHLSSGDAHLGARAFRVQFRRMGRKNC